MKKTVLLINFILGSALVLIYYRALPILNNSMMILELIALGAVLAIVGSLVKWRLSQSRDLATHRFNFWRAALFLGVGFSSLLISSFHDVAFRVFNHNNLVVVACYMAIVFVPLVYYLSHLSFIILLQRKGLTSRAYLIFMAIGSLLLGVGTTLLWPHTLNITVLIFIEFCFLMISPFCVACFTLEELFYVFIMLCLLFFIYWLNFTIPEKLSHMNAQLAAIKVKS